MIKYVFWGSIGMFIGTLFFGIGYFFGITQYVKHESTQIAEAYIENTPSPVLEIQKIENGEMTILTNRSDMRIVLPNEEIFVPEENNIITYSVASILPMLKSLPAPEGSKFVVSKRGKTYWPLDAPNAFLISPKNRVFYKTEEEALNNGKKKGQ